MFNNLMTGTNQVLGLKPLYKYSLDIGGYRREAIGNNYYRNYVKYAISCRGITSLELPLVLKEEIDYHIYLYSSSSYISLLDINTKASYIRGNLTNYSTNLIIDLTQYFSYKELYSKSGVNFYIIFQYGDSISDKDILYDMMNGFLPINHRVLGYPDIPIAKDKNSRIIKGSGIDTYPTDIVNWGEKNWLESEVYGEVEVSTSTSAYNNIIKVYIALDQPVPNSKSGALGVYYNILDKNNQLIKSADINIEVGKSSISETFNVSNTEFNLSQVTLSIISLTNPEKILDKSRSGSHVLYKRRYI